MSLTVQERYRLTMAYWLPRGLKAELGTYRITPAMEREALTHWHQEGGNGVDVLDLADKVTAEPPVPKAEREMRDDGDFVDVGEGAGLAAVLCPGPSLRDTWGKANRDAYDLVVGVNNAATLGCDWWASHDDRPMKGYDADPRVGIVTSKQNADAIRSKGLRPRVPDVERLVVVNNAETYTKGVPRSGGWSKHSAIMLAVRLGCPTVHVYGDDRQGTVYFDGTVNAGSKDSRWKRESDQTDELLKNLDAKGVKVERILPPAGGED